MERKPITDARQAQRPQPISAPKPVQQGKPGERVPPETARVRSLPEAEKAPGAGGVPSPVGDNDLA
ncbi:MAG: hypothetical protein B7X99_08345 [Rhizobiales bacterium 17-65-6]|nr:MAG: hypothetical protein B7X99_08345 [Rhizobiales bacterium 17-65-6]